MNEEDQCKLLNKVVSKEISLNELKTEAARMKSISALKVAFVRLTNAESWEKARETYPNFATEEQLQHYSCCNLRFPSRLLCPCKGIYGYYYAVKHTRVRFQNSDGQPVTVAVIEVKPTEVSGHMIHVVQPSFSGADLAIIIVDEVSSSNFMCVCLVMYLHISAVSAQATRQSKLRYPLMHAI